MTAVPLYTSDGSGPLLLLSRWWFWLLLYLLVINLVTFFVYGHDKRAARKGRRRVPERTLLTLAAVGGALGALAGMSVFHHKTKKTKFKVLVPLFLIAHVALIGGALWILS